MIHRSRALTGVAFAATLVLAACGGDDDEPVSTDVLDTEPVDTELADTEPVDASDESGVDDSGDDASPSADEPDEPDVAEEDDGDDSDPVVIDDFDDIPDECVDLLGDFLRQIETDVSAVDWENATFADLEPLDELIEEPSAEFDRRATELGCDRFDFGADDEQSLEFVISVAEQQAPGTVEWLDFIAGFSAAVGDIGDPADSDASEPSDAGGELPTDCEGTKDYLLAAAEQYGSIEAIPVSEAMTLTTAITSVTTLCGFDDAIAFLEDPTITAFLDG
ncbi:MAG: hypothetical protein AAGD33_17470 [Actinomycetota bacterium]